MKLPPLPPAPPKAPTAVALPRWTTAFFLGTAFFAIARHALNARDAYIAAEDAATTAATAAESRAEAARAEADHVRAALRDGMRAAVEEVASAKGEKEEGEAVARWAQRALMLANVEDLPAGERS